MYDEDLLRVHRELIHELLVENACLRTGRTIMAHEAARAHMHAITLAAAHAAHVAVCPAARAAEEQAEEAHWAAFIVRTKAWQAAHPYRPGIPETKPSAPDVSQAAA